MCLKRVFVDFFFRNKCVHFLYTFDTFFDDFCIVSIFSRISENAWIFLIKTLFSWSDWSLSMFDESNFFSRVFFIDAAISRFAIVFWFCISFIIELCGCVNWVIITQLHLANLSTSSTQSMIELWYRSQRIFNTILWVIIFTISKNIFSACSSIINVNDVVSRVTRSFSLNSVLSSMIIKSYEFFLNLMFNRLTLTNFCAMKLLVTFKSIMTYVLRSFKITYCLISRV